MKRRRGMKRERKRGNGVHVGACLRNCRWGLTIWRSEMEGGSRRNSRGIRKGRRMWRGMGSGVGCVRFRMMG